MEIDHDPALDLLDTLNSTLVSQKWPGSATLVVSDPQAAELVISDGSGVFVPVVVWSYRVVDNDDIRVKVVDEVMTSLLRGDDEIEVFAGGYADPWSD